MLTSLWHRTICCRNNENSSIHLGCSSNHVFNKVSVSWAVNVCIVTVVRLIFNVCNRYRNCFSFITNCTTLSDVRIRFEFGEAFVSLHLKDSSCCSCLTMVNVTDRTYINVWFGSFECFLSHVWSCLVLRDCVRDYVR